MKTIKKSNQKKVTRKDLSVIMTRANQIFRNQPIRTSEKWSEILKQSWQTFKAQQNINFNEVYKQYFKRIRATVLKNVRNQDVTDDITNEVFIKFNDILNSGKYDARKSSINTYLNYILKTCISDFYRKEKKHIENNTYISNFVEPETGKEYFRIKADDKTDNKIIKQEQKNVILNVLNELSEQQKEITQLFYFNELKIKEIADILNISESNVKVSIFRVKKILKENSTLKQLYATI